MALKLLTALFGVVFSQQLMAFDCYLTLAKDNCWTDYDVNVTVTDTVSNQALTVVTVPKGQSWTRQKFTCQPGENLLNTATFSPTVWDATPNMVYNAKKFWALPQTVRAGQTAWELQVCFADAFSAVPMPATATGTCACDFKSIPPIPTPIVNN